RPLLHHREGGKRSGDVPHGQGTFAPLHHRRGRPRGGDSRRRAHSGRGPHRERRRHRLDARISWRGRGRADPPSGALFGIRLAGDGRQDPRDGGCVRHHHRLHGMPAWLQLLHHVGIFRGQGEDAEPLLHRGGAIPIDGGGGSVAPREIVLHHGREFPAPEAARHGAAGLYEGGGKELVVAHLLFRERHTKVQLRGVGGTWHFIHLARSGIAALRVCQARWRGYAADEPRTAGAWHRAAWLHDHRARASHAGEYRRGNRIRGRP